MGELSPLWRALPWLVAIFAISLLGRHPDRTRQPQLAVNFLLQLARDLLTALRQVGHIQESFIDRDLLYQRGQLPDDFHHLVGEIHVIVIMAVY